jgi:beta-lactamase superfamily II metal-dependent hydrolase
MFSIEMLPAAYGDCLWVEYGDRQSPHRLLIDGGISGTYDAIVQRAQVEIDKHGQCSFELLVISHVDIDHIDGIVKLLANLPPGIQFNEVWFNGWRHLHRRLGGPSGEKLTVMIEDLKLGWNEKFGGRSPAAVLPQSGPPEPLPFAGGLTLTLLSPTSLALEKLRPKYERECINAGLVPGSLPAAREALQKDRRLRRRLGVGVNVAALAQEPFQEDSAPANGSSIAFLAEFDGKAALFAADAHPGILTEAITGRLGRQRLKVDAFKLAHHGSMANSSPELLKLVQARNYLISTNGAIFDHPDPQTIARVLVNKKADASLWFNYDQEHSRTWSEADAQRDWGFEAHYPKALPGWLRLEL